MQIEIIPEKEHKFTIQDHLTLIGDPCHVFEGSIWQRLIPLIYKKNETTENSIQTFKITDGFAICYISIIPTYSQEEGEFAVSRAGRGFRIDTTRIGFMYVESGFTGIISMNLQFAESYSSKIYGRDYVKGTLDIQKKVEYPEGSEINLIFKRRGIAKVEIVETVTSPVVEMITSRKSTVQMTLF
jgi:hypothetical protein